MLPGREIREKDIHYNEFNGISSLDPAFAKKPATMWPAHQLFNTLVEIDDSLHIVPSLAKSWDISGTGKFFTFHLRADVFFHDDDAFPVEKDADLLQRMSPILFNRIIDKKDGQPGAWIFNNKVDSLQPFTAIDDSTFQLTLLVLIIRSSVFFPCNIVPLSRRSR